MCSCFPSIVSHHCTFEPSWRKWRFATIFHSFESDKKDTKTYRNTECESLTLALNDIANTDGGRTAVNTSRALYALATASTAVAAPVARWCVVANKIDFIYKTYQFDLNYVCKARIMWTYTTCLCQYVSWRHEASQTLHYLFVAWEKLFFQALPPPPPPHRVERIKFEMANHINVRCKSPNEEKTERNFASFRYFWSCFGCMSELNKLDDLFSLQFLLSHRE